jgi:lipoprotein-anchoring transpeptidase ErfK/SrfK
MRVSGHRISVADFVAERFWQVAALTTAGLIGSASHADAALYYWQDNDPGFYRPVQPMPQRRHRARRSIDKKAVAAEKDTGAKPVGPLIISISIEKQRVRVYDSNGFFAEAPVSTGMKGHPTPMGVFSIIQKHKLHHSNIYSGAPMPYMQRITWSGVAMHAGVLPGYPASHGCIRMPTAFAIKMWNWTKMGARVIVTPGEITPARFSHPLLVAQKMVPVAIEAPKVDAPLGVKSDKGADAKPTTKSIDTAEVRLELRSTVGHGPLTQTADASSAMPANAAVTMSDASPAAASGEATTVKAPETADTEAKPETAKSDEETAKSDVEPAPAKSAETASTEGKPSTEDKPAEIVTGEVKTPETTAVDSSAAKAEASVKTEEKTAAPNTEATVKAKAEAAAEVAKTEIVTPETAKPETAKPETAKPETAKADEPKPGKKPVEAKAADAPAGAPDAKKDSSRLPGVEKAAKAEPKREGQVAVFISRKDGKLYVRQNFKPVFEMPVTIAPSDRQLGTHVFTAEADKKDPNALRWSVVSLPVSTRNAQKSDEDERTSRRRKVAGAIPAETKPLPAPNSAAEALDRITIPQEAMARIAEALTTGGSIVVSDQGVNQGETGEGTDFIVSLR